MPETTNDTTTRQQSEQEPPSLVDIVIIISDFVRRHLKLIYVCIIVGLGVGIVYMWLAAPSFTAAGNLILDMRNVDFGSQRPMVTDVSLDSAFVESQVEVVKSKEVVLAVINKLHLTEKPEFTKSTGGMLGDLLQSLGRKFGDAEPLSEFELTERALRTFQSRLMAKRIGLSFIIEVNFRSEDPNLAAGIVNEVLDAYLKEQKAAKVEATRRSIDWLQDSIRELRDQAIAADRAVVDFKTKYNIVSAGGRLINEQQVGELSTQLVNAVGQKAEARARLERIENVLDNISSNGSKADPAVADSLKSEIITRLRSQYLDLANREAEWSTRYGADHSATVNLRDQMREIRSSMQAELRRIAETYKSDYQIAEQRESNIGEQLSAAVTSSGGTNNAQVTMRELESAAQTYRQLYDQFLHRHMEAVQQQTYPLTEGRILSRASKPLRVSWPRASIVYALSLAVGALFGILSSIFLDFRSVVFATRRRRIEYPSFPQ